MLKETVALSVVFGILAEPAQPVLEKCVTSCTRKLPSTDKANEESLPHTEQEPVQESECSYDGVTASNTTGRAVIFRASVQPALIFPIHLPPDSHDEYE